MPSYSNSPAMRSHLESQVNFMTELTRQTYDSVRKLSELNLQLAQQLMENTVNASRHMLSCSDPLQMSAAAVGQLQPFSEHLRSYTQQLMGVLAGVQTDLTRTAETFLPLTTRTASAAAEDIARRSAEATATLTRSLPGDGVASPSHAGNGANGVHHSPG